MCYKNITKKGVCHALTESITETRLMQLQALTAAVPYIRSFVHAIIWYSSEICLILRVNTYDTIIW